MNIVSLLALIVTGVGAVDRPAAQAPPNAERLLTPAEVEQAGGLKGIVRVARNSQRSARGDLNFGNASGRVVLVVGFQPATDFAHYKDAFPTAKPVAGVGAEAITPNENQLILHQGRYAVVLTSGISVETMKPFLGLPQLAALGKLIAARL